MHVRRPINRSNHSDSPHSRAGASTLDYILILCVVFPLAAFAIPAGKRIIELSYEMMCTMIAWPFL